MCKTNKKCIFFYVVVVLHLHSKHKCFVFFPLQEFLLGEWSCLHVVLDLIDSKQQGKYWCPPLLHRAALAFLLALWQDRRDSAISVLRTK